MGEWMHESLSCCLIAAGCMSLSEYHWFIFLSRSVKRIALTWIVSSSSEHKLTFNSVSSWNPFVSWQQTNCTSELKTAFPTYREHNEVRKWGRMIWIISLFRVDSLDTFYLKQTFFRFFTHNDVDFMLVFVWNNQRLDSSHSSLSKGFY